MALHDNRVVSCESVANIQTKRGKRKQKGRACVIARNSSVICRIAVMRIAFIGQKGIPTKSGGVERHVEELSVRLVRMGHSVTVYGRRSYGIPPQSVYKGVRVLAMPSIPTKNLDAITATFFGVLHLLFHRYDVVHFQGIGPSSLSFLIRLFKPGTLLAGTFHSPDYEHQKWGQFAKKYLRFGEYVICRVPHVTIAISRSIQRYAQKAHGRKPEYIPNGCSVQCIASERALGRFGLKKGRYILSVSRLVKHKGIHFLIEAFKRLEDTNRLPNNFKLVIVGASSQTDEYVRYLKFIARGRRNIVFTGEKTGVALRELFSHAYAFVQPSVSEGLSIALLEAMGYGLAPLVSDIPENLEAIEDAGFSFLSGNVDALEKKLAHLLNASDEVARVGQKASDRVNAHYHWNAIAKKTSNLYQNEWTRVFSLKKKGEQKSEVRRGIATFHRI